MPKVFEDRQNDLTFYIYSNDHKPPHVHVFCGAKRQGKPSMKISLGSETERPKLLEKHRSISNKDAVNALKFVAQRQQALLIEWEKIHHD